MKIELYHRILIHDKNGKLVKRTHWKKSRSFVLQFLQHIEVLIGHGYAASSNQVAIKDMSGTLHTIQVANSYAWYFAGIFAGDDSAAYGILVGIGSTAVTNADYALATKINHGVEAGQLDYGGHSRTAAHVVGSNVDFVISRTFYNGSGNAITVNEIGISCATPDISAGPYYFLLARDVVTPVTVDNAKTLTVQYTLRTTA